MVINNQREYLDVIKSIKQLEESFDELSYKGHLEWADSYYNENNYHFALFEYENCLIIDGNLSKQVGAKVQLIKSFLNPEERIIRSCFERGGDYYTNGDYRTANKYFTKIMSLASKDSAEYRMAKARLMNV